MLGFKEMIINFVDLSRQYKSMKSEIDSAIKKILTSSQFILGSDCVEFEKEFAQFIGVKYGVGVGNGLSALELGMRALDIGEGDEVLTPTNSFIASSEAISFTGAKPVLVDCLEDTFNIDVNQAEKLITKKTKAIMPVHLYGQVADMEAISKLAKKYKLHIIEDACQAHGARFKNKVAGSFGDVAAFSFYPGKNLGAYGDGGAIITNSKKLVNTIRSLREYGSTTKYLFDRIGYNSRLDSLQAAILSVKLKYLNSWNKKRQTAADYYNRKIAKEIPSIKIPVINNHADSVYHLYVIQTPKRDRLIGYLNSLGIQTGIHYPKPLHLQKSLRFLGYKKGDFPIAESLSSKILSLPMYPELTFNQQDYIVESIKRFFKYEN